MNSNAKIGLFGTGLDTYWGQFDGLLDELKGYQARIRDRMERDAGVQVADAGMVDSPARALEAASLFVREQVDLVLRGAATTPRPEDATDTQNGWEYRVAVNQNGEIAFPDIAYSLRTSMGRRPRRMPMPSWRMPIAILSRTASRPITTRLARVWITRRRAISSV